ncbi:MAG: hypothetical protein M0002_13780 [Rhodospirillales bacterium]|nr:hypothetical protein [Rhodospirillales bacterium]
MGAEVIAHPMAAGRAPNPRTVRARWLAALEAVRADGGVKGLLIYETPDGSVGITPTSDVSAAHTHGLLIAAIAKFTEDADDEA